MEGELAMSEFEFDFGLDLLSQEGSSTIMGPAGSMGGITSGDTSTPAGKTMGYDAQPMNFRGYKTDAKGSKTAKKNRLRKRF